MHSLMVKARVLEERLIQMYKQGDGYFWIGGPGEEAFNVPLGMLIHKGRGPQFDYCHFHYRNSATVLERARFASFMLGYFKLFENAWFQMRKGTLEPEQWEGYDAFFFFNDTSIYKIYIPYRIIIINAFFAC